MEARKNCCENFNRDIPLYWLSGGKKKKNKKRIFRYKCAFRKKGGREGGGKKGEYGWHCYTWHGWRKKSWGLLLSKKRFISHGCAREREERPRFWVTRPRVIPVTESACVKRARSRDRLNPFARMETTCPGLRVVIVPFSSRRMIVRRLGGLQKLLFFSFPLPNLNRTVLTMPSIAS